MKSKVKRFIAWTLMLIILLVQEISAFAFDGKTVQGVSNNVTEIFVNPLYQDVIKETDLDNSNGIAIVSSYANKEYTTSEEECADQIREGMKKRNEEVVIYYKAEEYVEGIGEQLTNLALKHTGNPCEGDYIKWQYAGGKASISMYTDSEGMCCMQITFTYTYYTNAEQEAEVDTKVQEVLAELDLEDLNDYQKIKAIYTYICSHTTYDQENKENDEYNLKHTAYAALIDGKAVCQGYALLFYRMALELGIDNRLIPGIGRSETHGWNIVKLNGVYYNVDATWDAGKDELQYFLKCDEDFENHTRDKEYATDDFYATYPMAAESFSLAEVCEEGKHQYTSQFFWTEETDENGKTISYSKASANIICDLCGETHKNLEASVIKDDDAKIEPTCTGPGEEVYVAEVKYNEDSFTDKKTVTIKETGHEYGEWKITKDATKTEEGLKERSCNRCGTKEEEKIPKLTGIQYRTHVQYEGWSQGWKNEGEVSGTTGNSLRLEAIEVKLVDPEYEGSVEYKTHVQNVGWQLWKSNGQTAGTEGQELRLEAIQIRLTGEMAEHYDIYYSVHAQNYGWLDWAKNGELAGTVGYSYRLEAIRIVLVKKGGQAPGETQVPYRQKYFIGYRTHVQDYGWLSKVYDGAISGTTGKSKRLEGIQISLESQQYTGDIEYRTHIQNIGWEKGWTKNGSVSGTVGKSYRLEAIQIRLTDEMEKKYDIYYRVHSQNYGWLDWAKNGEMAGTAGYSKRLEAIEIVLVEKDGQEPGNTDKPFVQK